MAGLYAWCGYTDYQNPFKKGTKAYDLFEAACSFWFKNQYEKARRFFRMSVLSAFREGYGHDATYAKGKGGLPINWNPSYLNKDWKKRAYISLYLKD